MKLAGHVALMGEKWNACRILVAMPEEKRLPERFRCQWKDNVNVDLREIKCVGMDWINLAQDRDQWRAVVNTMMKLLVP
jgi:hypothetical protein